MSCFVDGAVLDIFICSLACPLSGSRLGSPPSLPPHALAFSSTGTGKIVLKAQVLAGGRGKGTFDNGFQGGVHVIENDEWAVRDMASKMIGHRLITKQTGEAGIPCNMIQVVEAVKVQKEFYLALLLDRAAMGPVMIGSSEGGMDIEAVAEKNPDAIVKLPIDIATGLSLEAATDFARKMGIPDGCLENAADQMTKLYKLFTTVSHWPLSFCTRDLSSTHTHTHTHTTNTHALSSTPFLPLHPV